MKSLYQTWVTGGSGYAVLQDKLIVEHRRFNKDNTPEEPTSPNLVCIYNVNDISQETQILHHYGLPYVTNMIVDGVEMEADAYYQFDTVGNHIVEFILDDPTIIGASTFMYCETLTSITIPDGVTHIDYAAFDGCKNLTNITIPNSVTLFGSNIFSGCVSLPVIDNIIYADTYLVGVVDESLTSYSIKEGTRFIGEHAFNGCHSLERVIIPDSVISIESYAFYWCSNLTSVTIPDSVINIGGDAFKSCTSLTSITCYAPIAPSNQYQNDMFDNISNGGTLYVPTGSDYSSWMSNDSLGKYNWTIQYI